MSDKVTSMTSSQKKPSPMMKTEEASQITGLSQRSIVRLCVAGKLPAVRLGRRWLINREAFLRQLGLPEEVAANA